MTCYSLVTQYLAGLEARLDLTYSYQRDEQYNWPHHV